MGLQAHFVAPAPVPAEPARRPQAGTSLVSTPHNSASDGPKTCLRTSCPFARWVEGDCEKHEQRHWILVPCKHRRCETCGPVGRHRIAERIAYGCYVLWPAAWMVLTFDHDIEKKAAVRKLAKFVKAIRKAPGRANMQYAATYELTKAGRLHINLLCAPWKWWDQPLLEKLWGARLSVARVRNDEKVGTEAAGAYNPDSLGDYVSKLAQAVPEDRRVSYSKRWPKPDGKVHTKGKIKYRQLSAEESQDVSRLLALGWLTEIRPGEYMNRAEEFSSQPCDCFQLVLDLKENPRDAPAPVP